MLDGSSVDGNYGGEARPVTFYQGANAAKIAFAFFTDIAGEHDCFFRADARFGESAGQAGESGETGSIVSDTRSVQAIGVAFDAHIGGSWENGVEMSDEENDGFCVGAGTFGDDVAGFVDTNLQAGGLE